MDKEREEDVDYAAAYRQFMNFGNGRSLKQFCEDEDFDYGKLQRYIRKLFWSKHTKLSESEVEASRFMPIVPDGQQTAGVLNDSLERGDGFSDLKVQSVAVQSCFTNNRSQQ